MSDYMGREVSVEDYVREGLDGDDCERGALEVAERTASNCCKYLAKLTDALVKHGAISEDAVDDMLRHIW